MNAIRTVRRRALAASAALLGAVLVAACTSDAPPESPPAASGGGSTADAGTDKQSTFFEQAEYDRQLALADQTPEGPADKPWEQMLNPEMTDTSQYKTADPGDIELCFSNAGVFNPWRQVGLK
ncbi:ABC transporter substrate-binding protein, partial [Streptomyces niveus]